MWANRWDFKKKPKKKTCQVLQLLQESLDLLQHPVFLEGLSEEQVKDLFFLGFYFTLSIWPFSLIVHFESWQSENKVKMKFLFLLH